MEEIMMEEKNVLNDELTDQDVANENDNLSNESLSDVSGGTKKCALIAEEKGKERLQNGDTAPNARLFLKEESARLYNSRLRSDDECIPGADALLGKSKDK